MAIVQNMDFQRFEYTGSVQGFTVPVKGLYKLEVFGASGGHAMNLKNENLGRGGNGGHTTGYIYLTSGQLLQICIGSKGCDNRSLAADEGGYEYTPGGYNGGGDAGHNGSEGYGAGGGGATHIALGSNRGILSNYESYKSEILVVAGGGGGGCYVAVGEGAWRLAGGDGGGLAGGDGDIDDNNIGYFYGSGGTQSLQTAPDWTRARYGTFGQGAKRASHGGGGGGGWYGGGAGNTASGGGGSGYIGGVPSITYKGKTYNPSTISGYNTGNGAAIITLVQRAAPTVYLGTKEISAIYFGTREITDIKIHK